MDIITTTPALKGFCDQLAKHDYICVDTEFMRDSSFWSKLCLIQASGPNCEAIIDPLSEDLDMQPFLDLMMNTDITKVMHAARQDMEIFYAICGGVPSPLFDTQIAAMALGFGDSVGYMALVKGRLNLNLDKGARFTDWSRRPLSNKQLHYALGDVTHLRDFYPGMVKELQEKGRLAWVEEEMKTMLIEDLYTYRPENAWKRLKIRNPKQDYLAALKYVAAWREEEAQRRDTPRSRILKDDGVYDIAQNRPATVQALGNLRGVPRGFANLGPTIDMLKTLLRLSCEYNDIAPRLVANAADIEQLAAFGTKADVACLSGWRREVFGDDALAMLDGKIGLRLEGREVVAKRLDG